MNCLSLGGVPEDSPSAIAMTEKTPRKVPASGKEGAAGYAANAAFDIWLERKLHDMFDSVAAEPIPEDLLRVIAQLDASSSKK